MKNGFLSFLILQFLNVQIQSAFATEGVSQFQAAEAGAPIALLQAKLGERLQGMGERAQMRLAYRLFKINIALRNRLAAMSEETFQERMRGAEVSETQHAMEDQEIATEMSEIEGVDSLASGLESFAAVMSEKSSSSSYSKSEILQGADALLISLGAKTNESDRLEKISFRDFKESLNRDVGTVILKIILSLIVLMMGLAVITVAFAYLLAYALAGVLVSGAWFYFVLFATLAGVFFGIRAIIRASVEKRDGRGVDSSAWGLPQTSFV
ncbi:MAG: hypothetical protein KGP28_03460 [Bdellovibrionales bacterium]|nr:hypothetical protein [Bdellovibrionales bacterium]